MQNTRVASFVSIIAMAGALGVIANAQAGASHPKDAVDVTVENLRPGAFRVKPRHPLEPGEYAFYVRMGNSPMGQAWDFGVDQK